MSRKQTEAANGEAQPTPPVVRLAMRDGQVDADVLVEGISGALEEVRSHLQGGIDRVRNTQRDFVEDLRTAKMEADGALRATERMQREVASEVTVLRRAVEALRTEVDQLRRGMYRK
jgi:hypothetical protein